MKFNLEQHEALQKEANEKASDLLSRLSKEDSAKYQAVSDAIDTLTKAGVLCYIVAVLMGEDKLQAVQYNNCYDLVGGKIDNPDNARQLCILNTGFAACLTGLFQQNTGENLTAEQYANLYRHWNHSYSQYMFHGTEFPEVEKLK